MTDRPTASTITDAQLDNLHAQLDRVRALVDRWDNALAPDKPYARTLRAALDGPGPADTHTTQTEPYPPIGLTALRQVANDAICDTYQPPTSPTESGLCARCGMYDYKHEEQPSA